MEKVHDYEIRFISNKPYEMTTYKSDKASTMSEWIKYTPNHLKCEFGRIKGVVGVFENVGEYKKILNAKETDCFIDETGQFYFC